MADKPIPFSAPMVRAILDGRKTMTRRVLKPGKHPAVILDGGVLLDPSISPPAYCEGDRLWVKEALERANGEAVGYPADGTWLPNTQWHWKRAHLPSRFMPRWASRITLEVTGVRVERLQDISEGDVLAEGIDPFESELKNFRAAWDERGCLIAHREERTRVPAFRRLWESLHGPGAWEANPWVAAITFKRIEP